MEIVLDSLDLILEVLAHVIFACLQIFNYRLFYIFNRGCSYFLRKTDAHGLRVSLLHMRRYLLHRLDLLHLFDSLVCLCFDLNFLIFDVHHFCIEIFFSHEKFVFWDLKRAGDFKVDGSYFIKIIFF